MHDASELESSVVEVTTIVGRLERHPGVWVAPGSDNPRKIAAIVLAMWKSEKEYEARS